MRTYVYIKIMYLQTPTHARKYIHREIPKPVKARQTEKETTRN